MDATQMPCRICGNTANNKTHEAREMMYGTRETFQYLECGNCGCLQIAEVPNNLGDYYPQDYYSFSAYDGKKFKGWTRSLKTRQYRESFLGKGFFGSVSPKKLYDLFGDLELSEDSRILDVGCGNGRNFLYPLAEAGFQHVLGCDPYLTDEIQYENGLTISNKDVFAMQGIWDLITYHHAFEHLTDPLDNLKKVYDLLDASGHCVIRIPTASSYAWEKYGTDWVQLDAPRHIFLHTQESMKLLAEQSGLELVKVVYDSTHFQFTGSEKYRKDIPLNTPKDRSLSGKLKRKKNEFFYERQAKGLNRNQQGDQAAFFLRKK